MIGQTTRRALLGGAGLASVALVAPAIAAAMPVAGGHADWRRAVAAYTAARAVSDACPANHPDEDALLDAYCEAMDKCIIDTPAPDFAAVLQKMDWARERQDGFGFVEEYSNAIRADVARLAKMEG